MFDPGNSCRPMSQESENNISSAKRPRKLSITKVFLLTYGVVLVVIFGYPFVVPAETSFTGRTAQNFKIAGVVTDPGPSEAPYRVLNLGYLRSGNADLDELTFLLGQARLTINVGDIHTVERLESHGDSQLVAFHYANTHTSTSIYRAYADRIEPVSYRVTSGVGQVFMAGGLFLPILIGTILFVVIYNWLARRRARSEQQVE